MENNKWNGNEKNFKLAFWCFSCCCPLRLICARAHATTHTHTQHTDTRKHWCYAYKLTKNCEHLLFIVFFFYNRFSLFSAGLSTLNYVYCGKRSIWDGWSCGSFGFSFFFWNEPNMDTINGKLQMKNYSRLRCTRWQLNELNYSPIQPWIQARRLTKSIFVSGLWIISI